MPPESHPLDALTPRAWLVAIAVVVAQGCFLAWGFLVLQ